MTGLRWLKIAAPLSLILLWQIAVSTMLLNPGLFPPPSAIALNFVAYATSGELATNAGATLSRLMIGLLIGGSAGQITAVAFYAMGDTKTPTMLFVWTFTIYIPIKVLVFLQYGLLGLAIATSVHLMINFLLQFLILERVSARNGIVSA